MPQQQFSFRTMTLDGSELARSAVNLVRVGLGLTGLVALIVGVLMTFWPTKTAVALTWLLAVYWIVAGAGYLLVGIVAKGTRGWSRVLDIVLGALMVIAGIVVLGNPTESAVVLGIFLGIYIGLLWVFEGVVTLLQSGDAPSRSWAIFFGIVSVLAGISVFTSPLWGIAVLFLFAGLALIVLGVLQIVRAFTFGKGFVEAFTDVPPVSTPPPAA